MSAIYINKKSLEQNLTPRGFQLLLYCLFTMNQEGAFRKSFRQISKETGLCSQFIKQDFAELERFVHVGDDEDEFGRREFKVSNYQAFCKVKG